MEILDVWVVQMSLESKHILILNGGLVQIREDRQDLIERFVIFQRGIIPDIALVNQLISRIFMKDVQLSEITTLH